MNRQHMIACALLICSGCAHRMPLQDWRFQTVGAAHVLTPPDVSAPDLARRTFTTPIAMGRRDCPDTRGVISIKPHGTQARITVTRDSLIKQSPGYLGAWAVQLEGKNCVAPGDGMKLATMVAESLPLDPAVAFRLLYPDDRQSSGVDLGPEIRLQVVSPLLRNPGAPIIEGPLATSGSGNQVTVTLKATDNLLGYEKTLYSLQPKAGQPGYIITPLYTDRHTNSTGTTERLPRPAEDYLQFPPDAAFYRLFYESWRNDFSALVIAARTTPDLDRRTRILDASGESASCDKLNGEMCVAIPKEVAVNPMISVTVNGTEVLTNRGATLFNAIRSSGEPQPDTVLPRLSISKPWNGRPMPVTFDPSDPAILRLILRGGEIITWRP